MLELKMDTECVRVWKIAVFVEFWMVLNLQTRALTDF